METVLIEFTQIRWFLELSGDRLDLVDAAKGTQNLASSRGATRHESTQIRWFSGWPGGRLDLVRGDQRCSRESLEKNSRKPRDLV
jgi:hypothetical protein